MIAIDHLAFGYGQERLFNDISMNWEPGNIYGLLGMNGAGKSTLLKLMAGLLFPDSGTLRALGYDPSRREPGFLSKVFVLPEELNMPAITEREYLSVRVPFYPDFNHQRFERYITEFEIPRGRKLTSLSYGQKKKFLLSFGLACESALLVLDEPTNGLDIPAKAQFRRLVAEALSDRRVFIISTHQVQDVASLIDPIVILHQGSVLFNHTLAEVSARIRMSHTASRPSDDEQGLLYSEAAVGGFRSVWKDSDAEDKLIDLEVLFNTVVSRPDLSASLFDVSGGRS